MKKKMKKKMENGWTWIFLKTIRIFIKLSFHTLLLSFCKTLKKVIGRLNEPLGLGTSHRQVFKVF